MPAGPAAFQRWIAARKTVAEKSSEQNIDPLEDGDAKLFWIGDRDSSSAVVLFLHGKVYHT